MSAVEARLVVSLLEAAVRAAVRAKAPRRTVAAVASAAAKVVFSAFLCPGAGTAEPPQGLPGTAVDAAMTEGAAPRASRGAAIRLARAARRQRKRARRALASAGPGDGKEKQTVNKPIVSDLLAVPMEGVDQAPAAGAVAPPLGPPAVSEAAILLALGLPASLTCPGTTLVVTTPCQPPPTCPAAASSPSSSSVPGVGSRVRLQHLLHRGRCANLNGMTGNIVSMDGESFKVRFDSGKLKGSFVSQTVLAHNLVWAPESGFAEA